LPVDGASIGIDLSDVGANPDQAQALIRSILTRRNSVIRQAVGGIEAQAIVANVDAIWIVCGLDRDQGRLPRCSDRPASANRH
jgi:ABC-type uncharacterized transport system substrate-binding protein